jgi:hypothetical protein
MDILAGHLERVKSSKNWYNVDMKANDSKYVEDEQPVAYDVKGRPLYLHPQKKTKDGSVQPQIVHLTRSTNPTDMVITPATKLKHDRSVELYPSLNLSKGEYVISSVKRHPIGLVPVFAVGLFLLSLSIYTLFNYEAVMGSIGLNVARLDVGMIIIAIMSFIALTIVGMYVGYFVFTQNEFYLTNESVIQELQTGLFYKKEQTVSLMNIEDASYTQRGIIQHLFDFGSIRLSTEGDETTYRFHYVSNPKEHVAVLNNAVEAFKNGHPLDGPDD